MSKSVIKWGEAKIIVESKTKKRTKQGAKKILQMLVNHYIVK